MSILNLQIDQGANFSREIEVLGNDGVTPRDLAGATVTSHLRKNYTSTAYTAINATPQTPFSAGKIVMSLTHTDTALLKHGRYVYDLEILQSDTIDRIIEGVITIKPEVTKVV